MKQLWADHFERARVPKPAGWMISLKMDGDGAQISFGEPSSAPDQLVTLREAFVPEPGFQLASLASTVSPTPQRDRSLQKSKSDPVRLLNSRPWSPAALRPRHLPSSPCLCLQLHRGPPSTSSVPDLPASPLGPQQCHSLRLEVLPSSPCTSGLSSRVSSGSGFPDPARGSPAHLRAERFW